MAMPRKRPGHSRWIGEIGLNRAALSAFSPPTPADSGLFRVVPKVPPRGCLAKNEGLWADPTEPQKGRYTNLKDIARSLIRTIV